MSLFTRFDEAKYKELFEELWTLLEEANATNCFDCGKPLKRRNVVMICDSVGFLMFCEDCNFFRIKIKETWRKLFK